MRTLGFCLLGGVCWVLAACGSRGSATKESIVGTWNGIDGQIRGHARHL
jgi:hypothetical protein